MLITILQKLLETLVHTLLSHSLSHCSLVKLLLDIFATHFHLSMDGLRAHTSNIHLISKASLCTTMDADFNSSDVNLGPAPQRPFQEAGKSSLERMLDNAFEDCIESK